MEEKMKRRKFTQNISQIEKDRQSKQTKQTKQTKQRMYKRTLFQIFFYIQFDLLMYSNILLQTL